MPGAFSCEGVESGGERASARVSKHLLRTRDVDDLRGNRAQRVAKAVVAEIIDEFDHYVSNLSGDFENLELGNLS